MVPPLLRIATHNRMGPFNPRDYMHEKKAPATPAEPDSLFDSMAKVNNISELPAAQFAEYVIGAHIAMGAIYSWVTLR